MKNWDEIKIHMSKDLKKDLIQDLFDYCNGFSCHGKLAEITFDKGENSGRFVSDPKVNERMHPTYWFAYLGDIRFECSDWLKACGKNEWYLEPVSNEEYNCLLCYIIEHLGCAVSEEQLVAITAYAETSGGRIIFRPTIDDNEYAYLDWAHIVDDTNYAVSVDPHSKTCGNEASGFMPENNMNVGENANSNTFANIITPWNDLNDKTWDELGGTNEDK